MAKKGEKAVAVRDNKGHFVAGQSGNPSGLPVNVEVRAKQKVLALKENLELAVRQGPLNADRVCKIINKMCDLAEKGDVKAAKLVIALAVSSAGANNSDGPAPPPSIVIRVENATFKASAEVVPDVKIRIGKATDAEFTEVKKNG